MNRNYSAYWIAPDGGLHPVLIHHINFLSDNKEKFGITLEHYNATFHKYKEPFGFEGKAREILMIEAFQQGWIRIRLGENLGWKIETWNFGEKEIGFLEEWFNQMNKLKGDEFLWFKARVAVHNIPDVEIKENSEPDYQLQMMFRQSEKDPDKFQLIEVDDINKY